MVTANTRVAAATVLDERTLLAAKLRILVLQIQRIADDAAIPPGTIAGWLNEARVSSSEVQSWVVERSDTESPVVDIASRITRLQTELETHHRVKHVMQDETSGSAPQANASKATIRSVKIEESHAEGVQRGARNKADEIAKSSNLNLILIDDQHDARLPALAYAQHLNIELDEGYRWPLKDIAAKKSCRYGPQLFVLGATAEQASLERLLAMKPVIVARPSIVLLDQYMDYEGVQMKGSKICKVLRKSGWGCVIIMRSGCSEDGHLKEFQQCGADGNILKSSNVERVCEELMKWKKVAFERFYKRSEPATVSCNPSRVLSPDQPPDVAAMPSSHVTLTNNCCRDSYTFFTKGTPHLNGSITESAPS